MTAMETTVQTSEKLYELTKEFLGGVRAHFENVTLEGETTLMIDRICAASAAVVAVALLAAPIKGKDKYVTVLFAAAGRLWNRRGL